MYHRKIYGELQEWAQAGLIKPFGLHSVQDDAFVEVLKAVREHLTSNPGDHTKDESDAE
jgi:hypothetical protein